MQVEVALLDEEDSASTILQVVVDVWDGEGEQPVAITGGPTLQQQIAAALREAIPGGR